MLHVLFKYVESWRTFPSSTENSPLVSFCVTGFYSRQSECHLIAVQRNNALKFSTWLLVMDESAGMHKKREEMSYLKSKF